jgi:hypothetical protein
MTATFAQRMQASATRLISKYGDAPVTFTRITPGAFVPSTGAVGSGSTLTYVAQGVSSAFTSQEINGSTVLFNDLKYVIDVTTQVPAVNDTVVLSGVTYRIMSVITDSAQNTNICHTLQLRV